MPENAALSQLSKNEGITRRDFLKLGLGGFAATLMNFAIGSVIEKDKLNCRKFKIVSLSIRLIGMQDHGCGLI